MKWTVLFEQTFQQELMTFAEEVQDELLAQAKLLETFGPQLGRPRVDTLKGSRYPNMKELRFEAASGVWRVAFAFDPNRQAILLVAGDKSGASEKRFYKQLIARADARFTAHLASLSGKSPRRQHKWSILAGLAAIFLSECSKIGLKTLEIYT